MFSIACFLFDMGIFFPLLYAQIQKQENSRLSTLAWVKENK